MRKETGHTVKKQSLFMTASAAKQGRPPETAGKAKKIRPTSCSEDASSSIPPGTLLWTQASEPTPQLMKKLFNYPNRRRL